MVSKYTLDNGMVILLESIEGVASVSAGLWVKTGSRNEQSGQMGYAHFIEHMLFKGTANYSARDIARMVDRVGGQHNAATNREYTCYYINVISDYLELSVDLLADMYYRSLFDADEISKEKNVILEEIRMYEDTPDELIHDVFMECMLSDHPLGHPILGTIESIDGIDRDRLLGFFGENYSTENCIFSVAGNFDIDETKRLIERSFARPLPSASTAVRGGNTPPRRIFRRHITRDLEQIHFCLGTEGLSGTTTTAGRFFHSAPSSEAACPPGFSRTSARGRGSVTRFIPFIPRISIMAFSAFIAGPHPTITPGPSASS